MGVEATAVGTNFVNKVIFTSDLIFYIQNENSARRIYAISRLSCRASGLHRCKDWVLGGGRNVLSGASRELHDALAEPLRAGADALPQATYCANEIPGWVAAGLCHDCIDRWLANHPGDRAIRGWLIDGEAAGAYRVVAHSMIRSGAGELLDVTLARAAVDRRFIEHPAQAGGFFAQLCANPPTHELWVHLSDETKLL